MVAFSRFDLALLGFTALAAAAPLSAVQKKSFSLNQVAVKPTKTLNGAGHYAKALRKYGATIPAHVLAAVESGSVATTPQPYDLEYLTQIDVGGTLMNLDIDTGSSDL